MSGGWVLLQQRINGTVDFFNDWLSYKYGFGVAGFEFWLGNQPVYAITATGRHVLRLEMYYSNGSFVFAEYDNFRVASRRTNYTLHVGQYRGNLSNILSPANNSAFSSWDRDVDMVDGACARVKKGAWWYNSSCDIEDLNSNLLNLTERGLLKVVMKSKPFKYAKGEDFITCMFSVSSTEIFIIRNKKVFTKSCKFLKALLSVLPFDNVNKLTLGKNF